MVLRRLTLILVMAFVGSLQLSAQKVGIVGGFHVSNAGGDPGFSTDARLNVNAGVVGEFELSKNIYFQTGLRYYLKGFKVDLDQLSSLIALLTKEDIDNAIKLNYVNIPLNFKFNSSKGWTEFFVQAGPYVGIGVSSKSDVFEDQVALSFGSEDNQLKRLSFGLQAAVGVELASSQISFGYQTDLNNIYRSDDFSLRNSLFEISFVQFLFGAQETTD